tara:strand:- start:2206 stop:2694 length:489 start_codon:yes stop_codon:yes gene_type:complete
MNNEPEFDPTLESELRQTRPAEIDQSLLERIGHSVSTGKTNQQESILRSNRWLWLIPCTATAVIVLALVLASPQETEKIITPEKVAAKPTEEQPIELFPIRKNNKVVEAVNEGIIQINGKQPYRSVRMQVIDSYEWSQPNGATRVQYQIPREERFLVPAEIY